jgi:hypothetical protein
MMFPRRLWHRETQEQPKDPTATAARIRAERDLEARSAETQRVRAMTKEWERIRERNHFAAAIRQSFRGGDA